MKKSIIVFIFMVVLITYCSETNAQPILSNPAYKLSVYATVIDPFHLAFDGIGNLYVGRDNSGSGGGSADAVKIHKVLYPTLAVQEFGDSIPDPDGVIVDQTGSIIVSDGNGKIYKITSDASNTSIYLTNSTYINNPQQLDFNSQGDILWANCGNGTVGKFASGTISSFPSGDTICLGGIAVGPSDSIFASKWTSSGRIVKFNSDGSISNASFVTGLQWPDAMAYDFSGGFGGKLFVVERYLGTIKSIDPISGDVDTFASGFNLPFGLAFGPDGCFYVSEFGADKIWKICPIIAKINIKPGSDPNSINFCSSGTTPVTIWGSEAFDVYTIDVDQLILASASVKTVGKTNRFLCSIEDVGSYGEGYFDKVGPMDGYPDLTCHFMTMELSGLDDSSQAAEIAIVGCNTPPCTEASLGYYSIKASDSVNIVKDCN